MYCKKCNKKFSGGEKFCTSCGQPLSAKGVDSKVLIIAVIVVLLAVIVGLGGFAYKLIIDKNEVVRDDDDYDFKKKDSKADSKEKDKKANEDAENDLAEGELIAEAASEESESFEDFLANEHSINGKEYDITIYRNDDDYYGEADYSVIEEGIIGYKEYDFDSDGADELLVLKHIGDGKLELFMYENEAGSIKEAAATMLDGSYIQMYAYMEGKIALYHNADTIFVEDSNVAWLFADGVSLNILGLRYDGDDFEVVLKSSCSGSDIDEDNMLMHDLAAYGVPKSAFNALFGRKKFIYNYLEDVNGICQIKTKHIIGSDEAWEWSDNLAIESMKLSEIKIKDLEIDETVDVDNEFILVDSDARYIDEYELEGFDKEMCRLARNEIFARRGRIFDDEGLRAYFESKDWYQGYLDGDSFDESFLNDYELKNLDKIIAYEKAHGFR